MQRLRFGTTTLIAVLALVAMSFAQSAQNGNPPGSPQQSTPPASAGQQGGGATAPGQQGTLPGSPAQQNPSGSPRGNANAAAPSPAGVVANQLAELLNLSDTQTSQVKNVLEDERGKLLSLRDDPTLSDGDKQAKLLVIRQNASDQIMSILSPEQRNRLVEAIRSQQQQNEQQPETQPPQQPQQPPAAQPPAQQPPVQQPPPPNSL